MSVFLPFSFLIKIQTEKNNMKNVNESGNGMTVILTQHGKDEFLWLRLEYHAVFLFPTFVITEIQLLWTNSEHWATHWQLTSAQRQRRRTYNWNNNSMLLVFPLSLQISWPVDYEWWKKFITDTLLCSSWRAI